MSQPAARPMGWWPYALAGVAAAVVAALLLLHPASSPVQEPDRLVEVSPRTRPTTPDSAGQGAQAGAHPALGLPPDDSSAPTSADPTTPSFAGLTGESPSTITAPEGDGNSELPSSNPVQAEPPTSEQTAGEDAGIKIASVSSNPGGNEAGWDFPEEPASTRRSQHRRISLRVHAATAGSSFSGGVASKLNGPQAYASQPGVGEGRWVAVEDASASYPFDLTNVIDANLPNGNGVKWVYVQQVSENEVKMVSVPKAPALPVAVGVSLSLSLSRSWVLSAGLDYMQRDGYRMNNGQPQSLTLHYLGIPVDLQYYFNPESRWRFYLGAGAQAAKCIAATGGQALQDPVLFSGSVMAGTDFRLFPGVRLYLAPVLSVPFNRSTYVNSWDDRLQFQVRAGLSFDLK